jgi:hypothetical protein
MLYGENVAICFEINTQHINIVWQNAKPVGASRTQQTLKG